MPRAGLTQEVVVGVAAGIADDVGYDHLTLAAVAEHFGVAVPSLYKHVGGLDDLRRRLAARAINELGARLSESVASVGERPLHALAAAYRSYARSHPGRYAATLRAPDAGNAEAVAAGQAVLDTVFGVLAGYGLAGGDAVDATRALRSALHGFVSLEAAGGFGMPQDVDRSFERLIDLFDNALHNWTAGEPDGTEE